MLRQVAAGLGIAWGISELALGVARRSRAGAVRHADRGSLAGLWIAIALGLFAFIQLAGLGRAPLPGSSTAWALAGAIVLLAGVAVRWSAILALREAFTVDVAIAPAQRIVERGPYAVLRHPAYAGMLLAFFGVGLSSGDALALAALMAPVAVGLVYRVRIEERALKTAFGPEYESYCRRTKRLVPFVF